MSETNPMDPFGIAKAWTTGIERSTNLTVEQLRRAADQAVEIERQARLTAAKMDVDTAYVTFRNTSDQASAENLAAATEMFLKVCRGVNDQPS
jgi:hypothetical protein